MSLTAKDWLLNPHTFEGFRNASVASHAQRGEHIHHTEIFEVEIPRRYALVNATQEVQRVVERSKVEDGFCFVTTLHITAGIYINDAESGLLSDISTWIEHLAPFGKNYAHHQTGEDNGDAHLKSFLTNSSVTLPLSNHKLNLGTWQQIFYAEYDGLRKKKLLVKVTGLASLK